MKNGSLAIFDYEINYANGLMDYMKRKGRLSFQISAFSNMEYLLEYINHNTVDILLIGEDSIPDFEKMEHPIKNVYVLSEGQSVRENSIYPNIYKFQSAETIMKEFLELYMTKEPGQEGLVRITNTVKTHMIGVFSPNGGSRKTTFCMALSEYYGMRCKTLYINFELFCDLSWLHVQGKVGFSELLYYIKQKKPGLMMKINALVCNHNNFDIIPPVRHYQDLFEMNAEDVSFFLHCLREYSDYEVVIMDIGFFGTSVDKLLGECNKIYIPTSNNYLCCDKMEAFYRQMKDNKENIMIDKIEEVNIPYDAEITDGPNSKVSLTKGILYDYVNELVDKGGLV